MEEDVSKAFEKITQSLTQQDKTLAVLVAGQSDLKKNVVGNGRPGLLDRMTKSEDLYLQIVDSLDRLANALECEVRERKAEAEKAVSARKETTDSLKTDVKNLSEKLTDLGTKVLPAYKVLIWFAGGAGLLIVGFLFSLAIGQYSITKNF